MIMSGNKRKTSRIKEDWQQADDAVVLSNGEKQYGKFKSIQFPISLCEKLEKAAKDQGISQTKLVLEAVTRHLDEI